MHARMAADQRQPSDFRILVNKNAAGDENPVFDFHVTGDERATANHVVRTNTAIVGDVARGHDVVAVADFGRRLGVGAAADGVVFANAVAVADPKVTAFAREVRIERIGPEHGAG